MNVEPTGKVIFIGAGTGDPDLITVKAVQYLHIADVVLTDRLVSEDILRRYVSPNAQIIEVGKQCKRGVSTPQQTINELLVFHAYENKLVVRLKGGDVSVFSNILDELEVLKQYNIPYEIIPGITAALGAAAYGGIPLTARGYATAVRILTFHNTNMMSENSWKELAATDDTLVFYMSSSTLEPLVQKLLEYNISIDKKIAVIEQATTPLQQIYTIEMNTCIELWKDKEFISPSLIIIGKVVSLHEKFAWFKGENIHEEDYFKPLTAVIESLIHHPNKLQVGRA